jgi:putative ABC transport system permease protein
MIAAARRFVLRMLNALRPGSREADLERELRSHLSLAEEEYQRRGLSPDEAARETRRAVGSVAYAKDLHRDARSFMWIDDLRRDLQYAIRTLLRFPGFTAVVLLTLAIGIGANTAIFTAVHAVLLAPLPYPESERLVRVWENVPGTEIGDGKGPDRRYPAMEVRDLLEVASRAKTIAAIANYGFAQATATFGTETTRLEGFSVSGDLFRLIGAKPLLGRTIAQDDATTGNDQVVVLGYDTWQRFGGGDVIGMTLTFSGDPNGVFNGGIAIGARYTIVGVMPRGFRFPSDSAQFWVPRVQRVAPDGRSPRRETIARLAVGAIPGAAAAELATIRAAARGGSAATASGQPRYELVRLHDEITGPVRSALLVLTAAVGVVLLIACVNVANLLLARGLSRRRELAVRAAIGAGRGRLTRQLLTESVLLSVAGGIGGIAVALGGVRLFRILGTTLGRSDLGPGVVFPRLAEIQIDATVQRYAALLSIVTGLIFGLLPALRDSRTVMTDARRETTTSSRNRLKQVLVVAEIALATLLLASGGLLINSFVNLATTDPGFDSSHLLTFQVGIARANEQAAFAETLAERLRAIPGIVSAAYARQLPMVSLQDSLRLTIRRNGVDQTFDDAPDVRFVSHDYLQTLGVPIVAGRSLTEADGAGKPPVVLVNEALARRNLRGIDPIGQTILLGPVGHRIALEIVGVVGNVRQFALDRPPQSQYFIDVRQVPTDPAFRMPPLFPVGAYYVVRTARDPASVVAAIRDVAREIDGAAAVERIATMDEIISNSVTRPRMYAVLVAIFSSVAVVLAAIGLYGVMAYSVSQRTREIGIRMALGARRREVLGLIVRESAVLIVVGLGLGLGGAALTTRYLQDLLFGLTPLDPATFAAVALVLIATTLTAAYVPARRATLVDPLVALRCE